MFLSQPSLKQLTRPMFATRTFALLLLILEAAAFHSHALAQDYVPGDSWRRMEQSSQLVWVWGAAEGQSLLIEELPKPTATKLTNVVSTADAKVVSELMTQYYSDPSNSYIPWKYMAVVASRRLAGETETRLSEKLRLLREYAAFERARPKRQ
jgi:hypothetical protein